MKHTESKWNAWGLAEFKQTMWEDYFKTAFPYLIHGHLKAPAAGGDKAVQAFYIHSLTEHFMPLLFEQKP